MPYSYRNTIPDVSSPFAALAPPAADAPPAAAANHMEKIIALIEATHGPEIRAALVTYSANLSNAVRLTDEIERGGAEAGIDPEGRGPDWYAWEEEIRSAVASYHAAADAMADLAGTKACTISLLATLPSALLGRIIRAGLEVEGDELLNLLECVGPPLPENATTKEVPHQNAPGCAGGSAAPGVN